MKVSNCERLLTVFATKALSLARETKANQIYCSYRLILTIFLFLFAQI